MHKVFIPLENSSKGIKPNDFNCIVSIHFLSFYQCENQATFSTLYLPCWHVWFYVSARPQGRFDAPTHVSAAASVATRSQPRRENPETTRNIHTSNTSARRQTAGGSLKYPPTGPLLTPSCFICVVVRCEDETGQQKKKFNPVLNLWRQKQPNWCLALFYMLCF